MEKDLNIVTTGYYKNGKITIKEKDNLVLTCKNFLSKTEILLDKSTIRKVLGKVFCNGRYEIIIEWKDGKLSQAIIDDTVYHVLMNSIK